MYGSGIKISKSESVDKTPYTIYYPHSIPVENRKNDKNYTQYVSIDPAKKNYALRIERRYHNGDIIPIVFDKVSIISMRTEGDATINDTYKVLTAFLDKYLEFYDDCHYIIIERQLPQNYQAGRIAQHTISYFSVKLFNKPLLPSIIELDPKAKGKYLGAPKGITDKQLKTWAVETARKLLVMRRDQFSLGVLDVFKCKQDDLADTVCQIEAICVCWGFALTKEKIITNDQPPKTLTLNCNDDPPKTLILNSNKIPKIVIVEEIKTEKKEDYSKGYIMSLTRVVDVKNVITAKKLDIKSGGTIAISKINLSNLEEHKKLIIEKLF
jgi:hypothetical protein